LFTAMESSRVAAPHEPQQLAGITTQSLGTRQWLIESPPLPPLPPFALPPLPPLAPLPPFALPPLPPAPLPAVAPPPLAPPLPPEDEPPAAPSDVDPPQPTPSRTKHHAAKIRISLPSRSARGQRCPSMYQLT